MIARTGKVWLDQVRPLFKNQDQLSHLRQHISQTALNCQLYIYIPIELIKDYKDYSILGHLKHQSYHEKKGLVQGLGRDHEVFFSSEDLFRTDLVGPKDHQQIHQMFKPTQQLNPDLQTSFSSRSSIFRIATAR